MKHYKKVYSKGTVKPYARTEGSQLRWRACIKEGTVSEAVDEQGHAITSDNGTVKTVTKWRTLTRTFNDIPCSPYKSGRKVKYRGVKEANESLDDWRSSLLEKADAEYEALLARDEKARKEHEFRYGSMLVPVFLEMYFKELESIGREASTLDGYRYSSRSIASYFEDMPVGEVTEDDLKAWNLYQKRKGQSNTTRNKALRIFKQAFDSHARHIGTNPFEDCKKWWPHPEESEANPLTEESLEQLKAQLKASPCTQFNCAVELSLRTGMRVGEVCGLRWCDVDESAGVLHVRNAIGRVKGGTRTYEKGPKSNPRRRRSPERDIPISPKIHALLERRREYMLVHEHAKVAPSTYVCGNPDGSYANPTVIGRTWRGYSQNLTGLDGRRPTFHDLRDTYISYSKRAGADLEDVADLVGHTDLNFMWRKYGRVFDEDKREHQEKMDEVF